MGNREKIVDAALYSFTHKGFHQTSMRDIARVAGVSVGNLYNHFAGKEALIGEIAFMESRFFTELATQLMAEKDRPRQALSAFFTAYYAFVASPDNVQLSAEIVAEVARNPALAKTFSANQQQLTDALEQVITLAQQSEVIEPALNPRELAQLILDAIESQAWRQTIFPSGTPTAVTPNPLLEQLIFR
ncbi:TetR/AcrR family transcriptional regulator [Serratia inhibens]|uniref:TetR/AcrR family transcriptional regulator n=1 Tax=Serratia inhibens TaxID=2338073 RepID=UPI0008093949|nr:TetR/AcrR family transcriptional regulator [Serratia inhibens]ANS41953.1 HTH-type transcriptional regulator RcdA [Serratia inhibens PRI-2C]